MDIEADFEVVLNDDCHALPTGQRLVKMMSVRVYREVITPFVVDGPQPVFNGDKDIEPTIDSPIP
jgi:hypothetical protein